MIPIPVETDAMHAILNLPKEMSNNDIFREHQGLVLEMIRSIVLQQFMITLPTMICLKMIPY